MSSLVGGGAGGEMQGDHNYRPNAGEPWSAGRSVSGTWDDNALKKDFSSLDLNLRQTRQSQSHTSPFPGARADDRPSGSKNPRSNVGKDSPRYSSTSKPLGAGAYPGKQSSYPLPALGYDSLNPSGTGESDLTLAMRGMAVADDSNAIHSRQQAPPTMPIPPQVSNAQMRGASQPRNIYNTYPTAEYGFYPTLARDSFAEYPYAGPYGSPDPSAYGSSGVPMSPVLYPGVPPNLHPNTLNIRQQQPAVYFDYNAATRPSQFFFPPPQPMMYPRSRL
ncbi:hypothetical protein B0H12DRAFT_147571 [Mycena haematopus]|nr:hypothetical protein B0H12DRAFT_147571 [Mycena haematopus]